MSDFIVRNQEDEFFHEMPHRYLVAFLVHTEQGNETTIRTITQVIGLKKKMTRGLQKVLEERLARKYSRPVPEVMMISFSKYDGE